MEEISKVFKKAMVHLIRLPFEPPSVTYEEVEKILSLKVENGGHTYGLRIVQLDAELPENPHHKTCVEYEKRHEEKLTFGHLPGCLIYSDAQQDMRKAKYLYPVIEEE